MQHKIFTTKIKLPSLTALPFLLLLILTACGSKATQEEQLENSLLWRIEGNNLQEPSYLFGTIHLLPESQYRMPSELTAVVEESDMLVMELVIDNEALMTMSQLMLMEGGQTLSQITSPEDYEMIKTFFEEELGSNAMMWQMYERVKPIFLSQMVMQGTMDEQPASYEMELQALAENNGLEVRGLETVEEQVAIFDSIPLNTQVTMLVESLQEMDAEADQFEKLVRLYRAQRLDSLYIMFSEDYPEYGEYYPLLLDKRNQKWVPQMETLMRNNSVVFAVGAGHLAGPQGLVKLLRERGYTLTPITTSLQ